MTRSMTFGVWALLMCGLLSPAARAADTGPTPNVSKLRIAVLDFENKVPNAIADVGTGMADMLIRELDKIGLYMVLERAALADILGEQDFTQSGRVQRGQQITIGRIKGAQLLIKGAVTEFSYNVRNRNTGIGFRGFGIGFTEARARVAIDLRLIDAMTGEIIETFDQAAEVEAKGASVAGTLSGFSFSGGGSDNHPMGQAVRQLIDKSVGIISRRLDTSTIEALTATTFEGSIVKVDGLDRIVINRGFSDGVKAGDRYKVARIVEELIDPETGELLGREDTQLGIIEVTAVHERWAEARAVSGSGFDRGDTIKK